MSNYLSKILSYGGDRRLKSYREKVGFIDSVGRELAELSDAELRSMSDGLRERALMVILWINCSLKHLLLYVRRPLVQRDCAIMMCS